MEKVGIAVVGGLILIILIVGWANRGSRENESNRQRGGEAELQLNKSGETEGDGVVIDDDTFDLSGPDGPRAEGEGEEVIVANGEAAEGELAQPFNEELEVGPVTPEPEPRPSLRRHKLKAGETISHLAVKYLGGVRHWKAIVAANPGLDPARVRAGTEIIIPERGATDAKVAPTPTAGRAAAKPAAGRPSFIKPGYIDNYLTQGGAERSTTGAQPLAKGQYRVKKGDTLGAIAQKQLGSARLATKIYEANRDLMKNPNDLRVGWVLQIPGID